MMNYTIEGDPIIYDYDYDGETFTVLTDNTRDNFGVKEILTGYFKYILKHSGDELSGIKPGYCLSNDEVVYNYDGSFKYGVHLLPETDWEPDSISGWSPAIDIDVFVDVSTGNISNSYVIDNFYKKSMAGETASFRLTVYQEENGMMSYKYSYDGEIYTITVEGTEESVDFKYMVPYERNSKIAIYSSGYCFSNNEEIYDADGYFIDGYLLLPTSMG